MSLLTVILLPILFVISGIYLYKLYTLLNLLKIDHASEWRSLGEPTLFMKNNIYNNILVIKWLVKKKYLNLNDPVIIGYARTCRLLLIVGVVLSFLVIFGVFDVLLQAK